MTESRWAKFARVLTLCDSTALTGDDPPVNVPNTIHLDGRPLRCGDPKVTIGRCEATVVTVTVPADEVYVEPGATVLIAGLPVLCPDEAPIERLDEYLVRVSFFVAELHIVHKGSPETPWPAVTGQDAVQSSLERRG